MLISLDSIKSVKVYPNEELMGNWIMKQKFNYMIY
jgi:hypothetical protein